MGTLRDALDYPPLLRVGLALLVLALLISVTGFYRVDKSYSSNGTLGGGMHRLGGDDKFETEYLYHNRTLVISSSDANLSLIQGTQIVNYTLLNREIRLHPRERPMIYVFNGSVNYSYNVTAVDYPYAVYSVFAFVLMLVGGVALSFIGYTQFIGGDVREGKR